MRKELLTIDSLFFKLNIYKMRFSKQNNTVVLIHLFLKLKNLWRKQKSLKKKNHLLDFISHIMTIKHVNVV